MKQNIVKRISHTEHQKLLSMKKSCFFAACLSCTLFLSTLNAQENLDAEKVNTWIGKFTEWTDAGNWQEINNNIAPCEEDLPNWEWLSYYKGMAELNLDKPAEAVASLTDFLNRMPEQTAVYFARGNAYMTQQKTNEAIADFSKYIETNPSDEMAVVNRAAAYGMKKDYPNMLQDLKKVLTINPKNIGALTNLSQVYAVNENWVECIDALTNLIALEPNKAEHYTQRAFANYSLKTAESMQAAIVDYEKAISLNPHDVNNFIQKAICHKNLKDYAGELSCYETMEKSGTQDAQFYFSKGVALLRLEKYKEAVAALDKAIELDPVFVKAYQNRAVAKNKLKDIAGAKADMEKVKTLKEDK